ncbi:MAG: prolipoprotein diacylglyceryl transferase, partial [Anaerolineales bacterium]|nr:prolipoprotein diacylglyceryl transferase [Anaerolineales bacterium]
AIYIYRKQLQFWDTLDALTPLFAVMAVAISLSHLASGSAFGKPTDLPFGIHLWGDIRHPSQIYEFILASLILVAIYFIDHTRWSSVPGIIFLIFIALTAFSRLLLEAFRGDSILVGGGFRAAQLIAWLAIAVSLAIIAWRFNTGTKAEETGE